MRRQFLLLLGVLALSTSFIQKSYEERCFEEKIIFETDSGSKKFKSVQESVTELESMDNISQYALRMAYDMVDEDDFIQEFGYYDCEEYLTYIRSYYTSKNLEAIRELGIAESVIDMSNYSPYVYLNLPSLSKSAIYDEAYKLATNANVKEISISQERVYKTLDQTCETLNDAASIAPVSETDEPRIAYDNYPLNCPYFGSNVNIGILEPSSLDVNDSRLANITRQVVIDTVSSNNSSHGTNVAVILGGQYGIASEASIYFADVDSRTGLLCLENLIDANCRVINMSFGIHTITGAVAYDESLEGYLDYMSSITNVIMVAGCGNGLGSSVEAGYIALPAAAANVIAVGSCGEDGSLDTHSIYAKNDIFSKPNLVATGKGRFVQNAGSLTGTSFSTPAVTGTVALLLELYGPNITQQTIISILSATANREIITCNPTIRRYDNNYNYVDTITVDNTYQSSCGLYTRSGAGMLDISAALNTMYNYDVQFDVISNATIGVGIYTIGDLYFEEGTRNIIGVSFERNAYTYTSWFQTKYKSKPMPNYLVKIYDEYENLIVSNSIRADEDTMFANIKMVEFNCTRTGFYKVKVNFRAYPEAHEYKAFRYSYYI